MAEIRGIHTILAGDYPDPSIVRVGQDYYMTHSSFHYTPGLLVWHSRNLLDWEPIGHAVTEHVGGSIMAPDILYYDGLFYIYFPAGRTNWVVTAEHPAGPWSKPIDLQVGYIDPGHAVDQAGNRLLFLSEGYRIGLSADGLSAVGELKQVYDGWRYPKEWLTEGFYLESPKLTFKDGYYYMTSAQGGTAGPATSHMIVSARAKSLDGPWENSPHNPIIRTKRRSERWWSKGHGTLVDTPEGDWYIVYHAYEKDYYPLGRQTLIEPIQWTADGWFHPTEAVEPEQAAKTNQAEQPYLASLAAGRAVGGQHKAANGLGLAGGLQQPAKHAIELVSQGKLGLHWHFFGGSRLAEYTAAGERLKLRARSSEAAEPLLAIPVHHAYTIEVTVAVEGEAQGTLGLFYKRGFHCGIGFDGAQAFAFRNQYRTEFNKASGEAVTLRLVNDHHEISLYFKDASGQWSKLDHGFEMSGFHHNVLGDFLSLRIALDATGTGMVAFSRFVYYEEVLKA